MSREFAVGTLVLALLAPALSAGAAEPETPSTPPADNAPGWSFSATGMYYFLRDQDDFLLAIATAERGPLYFEARYNYEALDSGSLFAGWKFAGGTRLTWEATPIIGAVFGDKKGIAPGFEAAVAWGVADFYTEAEYVYDLDVRADKYTYAWSEFGLTFVEWLRVGIVGQRTTVYQTNREVQRGLFLQLMHRRATLGVFVFNPDDRDSRFTVVSLGAEI